MARHSAKLAGVIYEYNEQREVFLPRATEQLEEGIVRALVATPIRKGEGATGRLAATPGEFAPEVVNLLRTFATQSALAIQNARLFLEIEDKSR